MLIDDIVVFKIGVGVDILVMYVLVCNFVFFLLILVWVEVLGVCDIFIGVNVFDYLGYLDCCFEFIVGFVSFVELVIKVGVEGLCFVIYVFL